MLQLVINIALSTVVLLITAQIVPGFNIENIGAAVIACLLIGFMNFLIRPMLLILSLPINIITLGLFSFVINALILNLAAGLIDGFDIISWTSAIMGAIVLAFVQLVLNMVTPGKRKLLG